jgi:hypothetical protein
MSVDIVHVLHVVDLNGLTDIIDIDRIRHITAQSNSGSTPGRRLPPTISDCSPDGPGLNAEQEPVVVDLITRPLTGHRSRRRG